MTIQELKSRLNEEKIRQLLIVMGATFYYEDNGMWITDTICHHGSKPKLYFYKDSQTFYCYTQCGQMDVISLVMHYFEYDNEDLPKAIDWICKTLNISEMQEGVFGIDTESKNTLSDWDFIRKMKKGNNHIEKEQKHYSEKIMKIFQEIYLQSWIDEGISIESMKKYKIMYCVWQQKVIIPHYDKDDNLLGIRCRNLIDYEIEIYGKYNPFRIGDKFYNHALGENLYGLNHTMAAIIRKRKIMLVEAEKSVLQADTMFGDENFTVALCGSNLTRTQILLILMLNVKEVIVALDKQFEDPTSEEATKWANHIKEKFIDKLAPYVSVYVIWDSYNRLRYKDSPTDRGKDTLLELMREKIYVPTNDK